MKRWFIGEKMKASDIIRKLNKLLGGRERTGIIDIVENRLVGGAEAIGGVYETPGGTILYFAHEQLEMLCVDKDTLHEKQKLSVTLSRPDLQRQVSSPPAGGPLSAFVESKTQEYVTGTVGS